MPVGRYISNGPLLFLHSSNLQKKLKHMWQKQHIRCALCYSSIAYRSMKAGKTEGIYEQFDYMVVELQVGQTANPLKEIRRKRPPTVTQLPSKVNL